jgi:hypothetical protein
MGDLSDERTDCGLKLLPVFASEVILGFESCMTHYHILLSQIRDSTWRAKSPQLYLLGTGWSSCNPKHCYLVLLIILGTDRVKTPLSLLLHYLAVVEVCLFTYPLPTNGCWNFFFAVVA